MVSTAKSMNNPADPVPPILVEAPAPPPGKIIAGYAAAAWGYHIRRSAGTRDWLITYTLGGQGRYRVGSFIYNCRPGEVVTLAPGISHDYATANPAMPWEFYWAHFNLRLGWANWLQRAEIHPGLHVLFISDRATRRRLKQTFKRLVQDSRSSSLFQDDLAQNGLEEFLILAARQAEQTARHLDARVEVVLRCLEENLSASVTIVELAELVSLSPSRLAHLFKEQMGDSIIELHLKLRLRHASHLLERTARPIGEIAEEVGFQSPFHFSRQFKIYYGMSPSAYRRKTGDG